MDARQKPGGKAMLGEILLDRGLVTKEQLSQALRIQVGGMRRLGHILVGMKVISDEQLTEALSEQLKLTIRKVDDEFKDDVKTLIPRFLCRKYSVIPVSREANNVLRLAMADPLDGVAIAEVENYTGMVVQPVLSRLSDIDRAIPARIPFSRLDVMNPQVYRTAAKVSASAALVLLLVTGLLVYRETREQRYGTESRVGESVVYKNHNLTVDLAKDGSVYFSGRGAFASGYYGIRFENPAVLNAFVKASAQQFSSEQLEWFNWLLKERLKSPTTQAAAKSGATS